MAVFPKIAFHPGIDEAGQSVTHMVVTFYSRLTHDAILSEVDAALRDGIKQHFMEDAEFREKIKAAIEAAAAAIPLDVIAQTIKSEISELRTITMANGDKPPGKGDEPQPKQPEPKPEEPSEPAKPQ